MAPDSRWRLPLVNDESQFMGYTEYFHSHMSHDVAVKDIN